jgi:hypothetical protein
LADALSLCEMLAARDPQRFERAARRWLRRFMDDRSPSLPELALAPAALSDMRHSRRGGGAEALRTVAFSVAPLGTRACPLSPLRHARGGFSHRTRARRRATLVTSSAMGASSSAVRPGSGRARRTRMIIWHLQLADL